MLLVSPASYLTLAQLKSDTTLDLTDRSGNAIPDAVLNDLLEETSGQIDAYIKQSFLPREQTLYIKGDGSNRLYLRRYPLIYVRQVKIALPNSVGFEVPMQSLLVDYEAGVIENQTPLTFQGIGVTTLFPKGIPIEVTAAYGLNYSIAPPTFTVQDLGAAPASGLVPIAPGPHTVQVSSVTFNGESLPSAPVSFTATQPTSALVTITNAPGAMKYYVYLDGVMAGEILAQVLGNGVVSTTITASPPAVASAFDIKTGARRVPSTVDNTPYPLQGPYAGLRRAQKVLLQQVIWEQKNPSNQGIYRQTSGPKTLQFKDNLRSTYEKKLDDLLSSLVWQGVM